MVERPVPLHADTLDLARAQSSRHKGGQRSCRLQKPNPSRKRNLTPKYSPAEETELGGGKSMLGRAHK